ncbi:unnamed protein product [Rhodiola kirilowii]
MAIVLRYVNDHVIVMERFIGVVHVVDTTSLALKRGIDEFFAKYGLSLSKLRGQDMTELLICEVNLMD